MNNITIGISCGDINGIGLEVILKSVGLKNLGKKFKTVVYGSNKVIAYHKNIITQENLQFHTVETVAEARPERINVINCWNDNVNITLGKPEKAGGECAQKALARAVNDLQEGLIDALVTAPINKKAMQIIICNHQYNLPDL